MNIFVLLSRFPFPLEKGDKLRAYHQLIELSKHFQVHLCTLSDISIRKQWITNIKQYCKTLDIIPLTRASIYFNTPSAYFSKLPLQVGYFLNKNALKQVQLLINQYQPDHIYAQLVRTSEYVRHIKNIPKTLDYQDAFSKGIERRIRKANFPLLPALKYEFNALKKYERDIFSDFDHKTIISEHDQQHIDHPDRLTIQVIPNGVNTEYYYPQDIDKKHELVFVGNMNYEPNIAAVQYSAKYIMPELIKRMPSVKFLVSGASPSQQILRLNSKNILVSGWIDDIRHSYATSKIFLAPMQTGIGLQNKILQAMAMKLPTICSQIANNSLQAEPGKEVIVANSPQEYVDSIIALLRDEELYKKISENGYNYVLDNFNWEKVTQPLIDKIKLIS